MPSPIYRMSDAQLPQILDLLAAAGGTRRTVESWQHDAMTALVLGTPDAPAAVMPLARRAVSVAPGRTLPAGWISSNQFAARMGLRRQSRPTVNQWSELLPEIDALLVVRRDEPSLAGRWYSQVGFHDVLAIRCLYLDMQAPPASAAGRFRMQVIDPQDVAAWAPQMADVHRAVFGNYGGYVARHADFWAPALAGHYYREHYQFQVIGLWSSASLMGYAVVGWSGWHSQRPRMDILELATRQWDTGVAQELLATTCQLAWSKNVSQVRAVISVHDPYRPHLARVGFVDRWGYVLLAKFLRPQRYLDSVVTPTAADAGGLQLAAPGAVPLTIGDGVPLRVETDARTLTRLLLQRVEVSAAAHEGNLVLPDVSRDASRLSAALPWTPWIFHMADYI